MDNLMEYDGDDKVISNFEMLQLVKKNDKHHQSLKCGFPSINDLIGGFLPGEMIVVTGATKCGKTLFAQSLTKDFYDNQEFPLWFTYEVPPKQFLECFPLNSEDMIFYMPQSLKPYDINWVLERCIEAKQKYSCRVVFIDHLHYLFDMSIMRNPSLHIGSFVRKLKSFAIENEMIIFLICHTTKAKIDTENDMSYTNIRDSSFISQESDCVLFIHRKIERDGVVECNQSILKIEFHRRTGVMQRIVPLLKQGKYLRELSEGE